MQKNSSSIPQIRADRLWHRIQTLSTFTDPALPWTRRAFTQQFNAARGWLRDQMVEAGLEVSLDEAGNLIGRREGLRTNRRPLITGSHCDTVTAGGRFDGIIGVLAAIEVAQALREGNMMLDHPLEVIDFLSEEPSDYGISCVGSRGLSGKLEDPMLASTNAEGETLADGIRRIGGKPEALVAPLRNPDSTAAFVELHIEQGRVLELQRMPIGVVTHFVGLRRVAITVEGRSDHAGTTPMGARSDALVGAARVIEQASLTAHALNVEGQYVVATVGRLTISPNMANAVPGRVELLLEVRSDDEEVLAVLPEQILGSCTTRLADLRVSTSLKNLTRAGVTSCAPLVIETIERSALMLNYNSTQLPSGAGHDSVFMAHTGPVGMIFVPCRDGRSHCPEEWLEPDQLLAGTRVLAQTLIELDRRLE